MDRAAAQRLCRGDYSVLLNYPEPFAQECYWVMTSQCYLPRSVVEYRRMAFIAKENKIRVTFDHQIVATESNYDIFNANLLQNPALNPTLAVLEVKYNTGTVMTVIGNNIALSLGMVGALSIVRFRTAIKDSRDTTYIFWAIIVGICCGVGDYLVASTGSVVVFLVLLVLGRVRSENRILLIVRAAKNQSTAIEKLIFFHFDKRAQLRVRNTTPEHIELIYEMTRTVWQRTYQKQLYSMRRHCSAVHPPAPGDSKHRRPDHPRQTHCGCIQRQSDYLRCLWSV